MHSFRYVGKELSCEGVTIASLVKKHGTPLYVYSQATLEDHFGKLHAALAPLDHLICYAMKANSNQAVMRVLANAGSGFDTVSEGELRRVIAAGGDPAKCVFAGVGKTESEIEFALKAGIYCFNCESEPELQRINKVAARLKKIAPVAVAVPTDAWPVGLDSDTANVSTGFTSALPATFTVTVWLATPATKFTVPCGKPPPAKSPAVAGLAPDPTTAQSTDCASPV